ncbi:MAG: hypothetical protein WA015_10935, partial [Bryobacteraceae bacterium]
MLPFERCDLPSSFKVLQIRRSENRANVLLEKTKSPANPPEHGLFLAAQQTEPAAPARHRGGRRLAVEIQG